MDLHHTLESLERSGRKGRYVRNQNQQHFSVTSDVKPTVYVCPCVKPVVQYVSSAAVAYADK